MKNFMRFMAGGAMLIALGLALTYCEKNPQTEPKDSVTLSTPSGTVGAPNQTYQGKIPAATVKRIDPSTFRTKNGGVPSQLLPAEVVKTMWDGQSFTEHKTAEMIAAPPKGDVTFMFDLTGSMYYAIENAKVNSVNIMNAIRGVMTDTDFGVISHMDYNGTFDPEINCGYNGWYGDAGAGDYPYMMNQAVTSNLSSVELAIGALETKNGVDGPEDYARALYETTADASLSWRAGAKKVVVAFLDMVPHDCGATFDGAFPAGTGLDPGRDGLVGTADDLDMEAVIAEMAAQNILLIVLYNGWEDFLPYWKTWASATGGDAFLVNSDGTIPGDLNIADFVADKIAAAVSKVDKVWLEVCDPAFAGWLTASDPVDYTEVTLPVSLPFDVTFTVPDGTGPGIYEFDVCLMGDEIVYAKQHVKIAVNQVPVDFHPMSCPNPLNRLATGVIPLAILGYEGFDVSQIDPASLLINGLPAIRWDFSDVGTPDDPFWGKAPDKMACNILGPDGIMDLAIKVDAKAFGALFSGFAKGDIVRAVVKGLLTDGTPFYGYDILFIVK